MRRFLNPQPLEQLGMGLPLSVLSAAIIGALAWAMLQSARQHRSMALEGDARHLLTDVWTSAGVVVGVGLVALTGWLWLDPAVAVAVALNILREGASLVWQSSQGLMDTRVERGVQAEIEKVLKAFEHPTIRFDHITTRRSGQRRFVDLHMHMPGKLDAAPRGRAARVGGTGADERRARPARHHPAAAHRRGSAFRGQGGPDLIGLVQRVSEARVVVEGRTTGEIGAGLLLLVCAERGDAEAQADKLLAKVLKLRIFSDERAR